MLCAPTVVAVWLFLAAIPVFADGGPHVLTINNGSSGINADSCAGCHRIHSSQSSSGFLLTFPGTVTDFCLSCHGATGIGATTDVAHGVQYTLATKGTALGALRGGGFVQARIGSGDGYRTRVSSVRTRDFVTKVPVGDATAATSAHLALSGTGLTATNVAWGYGPIAPSNAGTTFTGGLGCGSCHNPHGNGQYRILNPIPKDDATTGGVAPTVPAPVFDAAYVNGKTRNYTVIQKPGSVDPGTGDWIPSSFLLYADDVTNGGYSASAGDYFHRYVPWNDPSGQTDAPNGRPEAGFVGGVFVDDFGTQMTNWCIQCHTRYNNTRGPTRSTGDGIFKYQHVTDGIVVCTTCHVAHGSNAVMNTDPSAGTTFSANQPFPGQTILPANQVGNSRLLKFDGRGTCLACHDPTNTIVVGQSQGPIPDPLVP